MMAPAALAALIAACAPNVHPDTMAAVVRVESRGEPLALNVNKLSRQPAKPRSVEEAAATARRYIARGHSVDLGLAQINSKNLRALGLSIEQVLDPCSNLRAGGRILSEAYRRAATAAAGEQEALREALSTYNTGSPVRGFLNGYVAKYYREPVAAPAPAPAPVPVVSYLAQLEDAENVGD